MQIVTAANDNEDYPELVAQCVESIKNQGYLVKVYDLGGLGYGNKKFAGELTPLEACHRKPRVILDTLSESDSNELVVWLDADSCMQERIDEIDTKDYDVGFMVRPRQTQKINTGTLFLYNTQETRDFVQAWIDALPNEPPKRRRSLWKYGDQRYLNDIVKNGSFEAEFKFFSHLLYCNYEEEEELQARAKITHYKGLGLREVWKKENA